MAEENVTYVKPLNEKHLLEIGITLGMNGAMAKLDAHKDVFGKLPGFHAAIALIEEIYAYQRTQVAGLNIRAAAKAGHDIQTNMVGMIGRGKIYAKPMDLEELAEFGAGE